MTLEDTLSRIKTLKRSVGALKAWETIRSRKSPCEIKQTASQAAVKAWKTIRAKKAAASTI